MLPCHVGNDLCRLRALRYVTLNDAVMEALEPRSDILVAKIATATLLWEAKCCATKCRRSLVINDRFHCLVKGVRIKDERSSRTKCYDWHTRTAYKRPIHRQGFCTKYFDRHSRKVVW